MNAYATILHRLEERCARNPDHAILHFLPEGEGISESLTLRQLRTRARAIASRLRRTALPGERVLLLYPSGLEFICALLGCFESGLIAVPCCPPETGGANQFEHLVRIAENCQPKVLLSAGRNAERILQECRQRPALSACTALATDSIPNDEPDDGQRVELSSNTVAFLQYTSGSTGDPKGVVVTHGNIVHNVSAMHEAFLNIATAGVSWLPLYHDMGLIGAVFPALWKGEPLYLLPPLLMLKHPHRWLQTISRYRADICPAPNFAFDYCVRRVTEAQKDTLDLSNWKIACIGAEPIRAETMRRFAQSFARCGFRPEAFYPCYGLAEATLFVTGGDVGRPLVVRRGPSSPEKTTGGEPAPHGVELVGCGRPAKGLEVLVVDPASRLPCPDLTVGEIWIRGPSVAHGYWNRAQESEDSFGARRADRDVGPYLRSGDLGMFDQGELFITGRIKDVIVIRGQNFYPADIEDTVSRCHPAFEGRLGAAFGCWIEGEEQLVIVQEFDRRAADSDRNSLIEAIHSALSDCHQLRACDVRLVRAGTLPKTTSGKIRRAECRERYLTDSLSSSDETAKGHG